HLSVVLHLVLTCRRGIKPSGSSHILLTEEQFDRLWGCQLDSVNFRRISSAVSDFESLSLICFRDRSSLEAKLRGLTPKSNTNRDTSPLNKNYQDLHCTDGHGRGIFENARVLYRLLNGLDSGLSQTLALGSTSWTSSVQVIVFAFSLWLGDERSLADRQASPKILDVAWGEVEIPTLDKVNDLQDIIVADNKGHNNTKFHLFQSEDSGLGRGKTETMSIAALKARLQDYFQPFQSARSQRPAVMLVQNSRQTKDVLKFLGRHSRERSASPRGRSRGRRQSASLPRQYAPMYLVEVLALARLAIRSQDHMPSLLKPAQELGIPDVPAGWCSGNDCCTLLRIFALIVKNPETIDDQKYQKLQTPAEDEGGDNDVLYGNEEEESDYGSE
ncbi:unnamed protein product, partial [Mycena citricolor]